MKKMSKAEQRITLATALLVLLTGILVSIAATLPLYRSVRGQIEAVSLANAHARQVSLEHQLNGYRNIADQFSSRTEIRRQLQAWLNGEISLEALQAFTLPRLLEPARPGRAAGCHVPYQPGNNHRCAGCRSWPAAACGTPSG